MLESGIKASREGSAEMLRLFARAHLAPRERPQPPSRSQGRLSLQAELAYLLNLYCECTHKSQNCIQPCSTMLQGRAAMSCRLVTL